MKTNTFNYFRNAFALIGFFIIACSVATTDDDSPVDIAPIAQSNNGKYQIALSNKTGGATTGFYLVATNTETGVSKTYAYWTNGGNRWQELSDYAITFTH